MILNVFLLTQIISAQNSFNLANSLFNMTYSLSKIYDDNRMFPVFPGLVFDKENSTDINLSTLMYGAESTYDVFQEYYTVFSQNLNPKLIATSNTTLDNLYESLSYLKDICDYEINEDTNAGARAIYSQIDRDSGGYFHTNPDYLNITTIPDYPSNLTIDDSMFSPIFRLNYSSPAFNSSDEMYQAIADIVNDFLNASHILQTGYPLNYSSLLDEEDLSKRADIETGTIVLQTANSVKRSLGGLYTNTLRAFKDDPIDISCAIAGTALNFAYQYGENNPDSYASYFPAVWDKLSSDKPSANTFFTVAAPVIRFFWKNSILTEENPDTQAKTIPGIDPVGQTGLETDTRMARNMEVASILYSFMASTNMKISKDDPLLGRVAETSKDENLYEASVTRQLSSVINTLQFTDDRDTINSGRIVDDLKTIGDEDSDFNGEHYVSIIADSIYGDGNSDINEITSLSGNELNKNFKFFKRKLYLIGNVNDHLLEQGETEEPIHGSDIHYGIQKFLNECGALGSDRLVDLLHGGRNPLSDVTFDSPVTALSNSLDKLFEKVRQTRPELELNMPNNDVVQLPEGSGVPADEDGQTYNEMGALQANIENFKEALNNGYVTEEMRNIVTHISRCTAVAEGTEGIESEYHSGVQSVMSIIEGNEHLFNNSKVSRLTNLLAKNLRKSIRSLRRRPLRVLRPTTI